MMNLRHRVLKRQLNKNGLDPDHPPQDLEAWRRLLEQVQASYESSDHDRYFLERSMLVSSKEMEALYENLQRSSESQLALERDRLQQAKDELEVRVEGRTLALREANNRLRVELEERAQAERQVRAQAELLDRARDAICVMDLEGRVTYWNKSAERLYGWQQDEVLGQKAPDVFIDPNAALQAGHAVRKAGEWVGEMKHVTRVGESLVVESRWTFIRGDEEAPGTILMVNTDVTEQKNLEAQFLRAQRLESLGTLAGGIAHDLNNILGPILMSIQLLKQRIRDNRSHHLLGRLEENTQRGADLVRQVLSFARGMDGERVPLKIKPLVKELTLMVRQTLSRSIQISIEMPDDLWVVRGDVTQIHQVLMNLCMNGTDAMSNGGLLRIEGTNMVVDEAFVRRHVDAVPGRYVVVTVSDTGVGMPPEVIDKAFEPFYTTKETGTGLGLATVLGIVRSHGGFITIESEEGRGTPFRVYLAAIDEQVVDRVVGQMPDLKGGKGEMVLVVDDEQVFREVTKKVLEDNGYRVLTASNGAQALSLYARRAAQISLVLTDVMMPKMDGYALIRALRELNPDVRIIAASGLETKDKLKEYAGQGVEAFLSKPYRADKLLRALHDVLHGKRRNRRGGGEERAVRPAKERNPAQGTGHPGPITAQ